MSWIWLCLQGHVSSIAVELPDQARVMVKSLRGCERDCIVTSPKTAGTTKCRQSRGSGKACTAQSQYAVRIAEVVLEGLEIFRLD